jgi:hypothetical protein
LVRAVGHDALLESSWSSSRSGLFATVRRARVAMWMAWRRRGPRLVEQVLHVADARHIAHLALDALDLLGIVELPA